MCSFRRYRSRLALGGSQVFTNIPFVISLYFRTSFHNLQQHAYTVRRRQEASERSLARGNRFFFIRDNNITITINNVLLLHLAPRERAQRGGGEEHRGRRLPLVHRQVVEDRANGMAVHLHCAWPAAPE